MSEAGGNEQDVLSVARTLDFSQAESGQLDGMNIDQADDVNTGEVENTVPDHHDSEGEDAGALQNPEEGGEEKGEEKHVISHGAEKGEHLNASSLREDEFQKLLLLAEEFEADEKTGDEGEETGNKEGSDEGRADSGNKEDRDGKGLALKVKPSPGKTPKTGATPNRKGPTPVARVSKVRPSTGPTLGKNDKTELDGTPKRKRHGEEGAVDSESRSLPTTPSVNRAAANGARKLTVPQPFALATDKRASLGGRPADGDLASRLALPSLKKAPAPVKLISKLSYPKPSEGPKRYEQGTGKVKNATSSSEDDPRSGSNPYPALKIKANQQPPVTNASSFQFKCDERAEKRREFYNKLEERLSAKEAEKTQIEAKTQEEIEAKIKELRKSLTFKANPMPSFYQEAPPPKVEIKKIPPTRAKSPKLGTSRRSSGVGTMAEDSRSCRTSRIDLEHKLNGLSDDGPTKDKKAVKKPSGLTKALSDKTMRSAKSNGRLDNSKAQAASASGTGETDAKSKENKVAVSDSTGVSDESKTNNAEAAQETNKDEAAPVGYSVAADGSNVLYEKDSSGGASEKAIRPSQAAPTSAAEEVKDKIVKTTKQKLKASTPILSSAAKRETTIKHSSKNSTEIAHSVADVAVAS